MARRSAGTGPSLGTAVVHPLSEKNPTLVCRRSISTGTGPENVDSRSAGVCGHCPPCWLTRIHLCCSETLGDRCAVESSAASVEARRRSL